MGFNVTLQCLTWRLIILCPVTVAYFPLWFAFGFWPEHGQRYKLSGAEQGHNVIMQPKRLRFGKVCILHFVQLLHEGYHGFVIARQQKLLPRIE